MEATMSLREILDEVCKICEVPPTDVLGPSRAGKTMMARHIFSWAAVILFRYQLKQIAEFLSKDHSTILNSRRVIDNMIFTEDEKYASIIKSIKENLREVVL